MWHDHPFSQRKKAIKGVNGGEFIGVCVCVCVCGGGGAGGEGVEKI